jgi:hypothetical protein
MESAMDLSAVICAICGISCDGAMESVSICVICGLQHLCDDLRPDRTSYNQPMTQEESFAGGCLCGAVRFEVVAPTKWCSHCHCSLCRRSHGAAFVTWFGVANEQFRFTDGEDEVGWYSSTPEARRGFCRTCGSTLFFTSEGWPGETHIALAHMDGPIDRDPKVHVFYDTHVSWIELGDDLRKLGGPSGTDPID